MDVVDPALLSPLHPCHHPGCSALTRERWCERHATNHQRRDRERRGSARDRGYTTRWDRYRKVFLAKHPLCVECASATSPRVTAATVVDHVRPHKGYHALFWDPANHGAVCKPCHDARVDEGDFGRAPPVP